MTDRHGMRCGTVQYVLLMTMVDYGKRREGGSAYALRVRATEPNLGT